MDCSTFALIFGGIITLLVIGMISIIAWAYHDDDKDLHK